VTPLLDAFAPAIVLIALGQLLKRRAWLSDRFWADAEKLVFYMFLPALLVAATATVDLGRLPVAPIAGTLAASLLSGAAISALLWPLVRPDWPAMTSAVQGAIRFNNLVGFALVVPLYGIEGLAIAGTVVGLMVSMINLITVSMFALGGGRRLSVAGFAGQLARNPLLVACLGGFALNVTGIGLPPGIGPVVRALGQGAVALGLMAVGAALTLEALGGRLLLQATSGAIKLVLLPAITWAFGRLAGLDGAALAITVLFMALPTASSSYIMARQMGGDAPLMAAITTTQHLAAVATLPVVLALAR
jgi:predicted permease